MTREKFNLLPDVDLSQKLSRIREGMVRFGLDSVFIADNADKYYLTGRVFSGYIFINQTKSVWFVRRPSHFEGENVVTIRKVENVADYLSPEDIGVAAMELNQISYSDIERFSKALGVDKVRNCDPLLMEVRSVKTAREIELIRLSSERLAEVYQAIPSMYQPGMTDIELQIEIERKSRLLGCLGIFRISGQEMELNMGSVLTGDNADTPSPYDFAMGGGGADPSLPVGADGSVIRAGNTVMVDTNGNFTGYMTDMTRTFACGEVSDEAVRAHNLSIDICEALAEMGKPGVKASDLYNKALAMTTEVGLEKRFMGHRSQAGFVGHGVGIVINELPVLAPRSRDILKLNNVIAVEPKFVIEGAGAVGVENTYVVREDGMERLTLAPEALIRL